MLRTLLLCWLVCLQTMRPCILLHWQLHRAGIFRTCCYLLPIKQAAAKAAAAAAQAYSPLGC